MSHSAVLVRWLELSRLRSDPIIALAVFIFAAFWGARFIESGVVQPSFYQREFAPAVMEACGKGFVMPQKPSEVPGLGDFLLLKQSSFACSQISPQFEQAAPNKFQEVHRYLMRAVALNWRLTGVSWGALLPLYALLFGLSGVAAYGVFRLGMGKPLAVILTILFLISPLQLNNLPHLRDYAKAPFIITIVFILGWLVKYPLEPRRTALLSALAGAVLGVGFGFRMDLLILLPAVLVTLAVFTSSGLTQDMGTRVRALGVFILTFVVLGWPILVALGEGGNTFHVILLGLFTPFDQVLNIQPSAVYEWGYLYNDAYTSQVLNSYVHRLGGIDTPIRLATHAYEQAGGAYFFELFSQFPADMAARFIAAVLKIIQAIGVGNVPSWASTLLPAVMLVSLLTMAVFSLRMAIFAALAILYLSGYPALQFHERHYFPLQVIPLFFIGFLGQEIIRNGWGLFGTKTIPTRLWGKSKNVYLPAGAIKRMGIFLLLPLTVGGLLFALRAYQQPHLAALLKNYEQLPFREGDITVSNNEDGTLRLRPAFKSNFASSDHFPLLTGYWGLELDGSACGRNQISVLIQYRYSDPFYNASREVRLDLRTPLRYMFHTYSSIGSQYGAYAGLSEFDGIDVSEEDFPCIKKFGELKGFEKLPLLMNLTFLKGWENERLYQTIGREDHHFKARRVGVTLFTFPETISLNQKKADELLSHLVDTTSTLSVIDKKATIADGAVTIHGDAPTSYAYALQLPVENSKGGRYLVAEGELFDGGLTLGLLKDNQWAGQVNVTTPGKFKIVMKPEAGDYTATLAHNVPEQKFNHFKLTRLGWTREVE